MQHVETGTCATVVNPRMYCRASGLSPCMLSNLTARPCGLPGTGNSFDDDDDGDIDDDCDLVGEYITYM